MYHLIFIKPDYTWCGESAYAFSPYSPMANQSSSPEEIFAKN